jgi:hypothetical protein
MKWPANHGPVEPAIELPAASRDQGRPHEPVAAVAANMDADLRAMVRESAMSSLDRLDLPE